MIGANVLTLNAATMIEALQEYFDKRLGEGHRIKVTNVETSRGHDGTFTVHVEGAKVP